MLQMQKLWNTEELIIWEFFKNMKISKKKIEELAKKGAGRDKRNIRAALLLKHLLLFNQTTGKFVVKYFTVCQIMSYANHE